MDARKIMIDNLSSPCQDCQNRKADPNCHSPKRCEKWAEFEEAKKKRKQRPEDHFKEMISKHKNTY